MSAVRRLTRADTTDLAFAVATVTVGIVGFRTSFAGGEELTVGLPSVVLGAIVGLGLAVRRVPLLVGAVVGTAAFFLLGPLAGVREHAVGGLLPTPQTFSDLVDGTINGWVRLLTTVPPAGQAGNLLAIPYLAGFAGACVAVVCALVVRRNSSCVAAPAGVMATSVLFGIERPAALLLQGGIFGALLVGWIAVRGRRAGIVTAPATSRRRLVEGVVMLSVAVAGGAVAAPLLPFVDTDDRYVLRDVVEPPFDPAQYPSPLTRFRQFHGQAPMTEPLLEVKGLPEGQAVRYAVMDDFDGYVWRASPPRTEGGGSYERVGPRIPVDVDVEGDSIEVAFTMRSLADSDSVWIPTAGVTTAVDFAGDREDELEDELRFNRTAQAAAAPLALRDGDTWRVRSVLGPQRPVEELRSLPKAELAAASAADFPLTDQMRERVAEWVEGATSPFATVEAIVTNLKDVGAYNDGLPETPIAPGHSLYRLVSFLEAQQPQGNGEQYAAAVAYLARSLGIPARVVLEFAPTSPPGANGVVEVHAEDARAGVEIALEGAGWVAAPNPTPDEDDKPTPQVAQIDKQAVNEVQPPPPAPPKPPSDLPDSPPPARKQVAEGSGSDGWQRFVWLALKIIAGVLAVVVVVAGPFLAIVMIKARRRRRRRSSGTPSQRVLGAWQELTDLARDHGQLVPPKATRREVGAVVPDIGTSGFPDRVDSLLFGPAEPGEAEVEEVWRRFNDLERELLGGKSRGERIRGAVSLTSLR